MLTHLTCLNVRWMWVVSQMASEHLLPMMMMMKKEKWDGGVECHEYSPYSRKYWAGILGNTGRGAGAKIHKIRAHMDAFLRPRPGIQTYPFQHLSLRSPSIFPPTPPSSSSSPTLWLWWWWWPGLIPKVFWFHWKEFEATLVPLSLTFQVMIPCRGPPRRTDPPYCLVSIDQSPSFPATDVNMFDPLWSMILYVSNDHGEWWWPRPGEKHLGGYVTWNWYVRLIKLIYMISKMINENSS